MNGTRQQSKPTAKQALARNTILEYQNAMLKLDIRDRTANMCTQMQVFEGIFMSVLDSAGTVGEAKRWYKEWTQDINGLAIDDPQHNEKIQAIIEKHGFEFTIQDHHKLVDDLWEQSKNGG